MNNIPRLCGEGGGREREGEGGKERGRERERERERERRERGRERREACIPFRLVLLRYTLIYMLHPLLTPSSTHTLIY